MKIKGLIRFPRKLGKLPKPSCLIMNLKDVTQMDVPSKILSSDKMDLGEKTIGRLLAFNFASKKPVTQHLNRDFALNAVLNIGWCSADDDSDQWVSANDYLTTKHYPIKLNASYDSYVDIVIGKYHLFINVIFISS